ncbi:MAG: hypothetical protein ACP5NC_05265 [Nitrososphaeria archaeon]
MAYHKIMAAGYVYTFDIERSTAAGLKSYRTARECLPSQELFAFMHSVLINFGVEYLNMAELNAFEGVHKAYNGQYGLEGDAYIFIRDFKIGLASVVVLILLKEKELSAKDIIELQAGCSWQIEGMDIDGYIAALMNSVKKKYSEKYAAVFMREDIIDDRELYGIIELDPGYEGAGLRTVSKTVSNDASMIDEIMLYYSMDSMVVLFRDEPVKRFTEITNLKVTDYAEQLEDQFRPCGHAKSTVDKMVPVFLDYLVEIEPLRLQHLMLASYGVRMKAGGKSKDEMARLKEDATIMLDFYHVISASMYRGVKEAMEIGQENMGINDLKRIFDEKMNLLAESIEMKHQLLLEKWNRLFTYTLAAVGFASVVEEFLFAYFKPEAPASMAFILISSTLLFILVVWAILSTVLKRK